MNYFKELFASRELLVNLSMREIKGKYKRTVFGQLWSLANPLAAMLIYTFVFSFIFRVQPDVGDPSGINVFAVWLLCGLLPWLFFANVANAGARSLVSNANLIQKVYFPRVVLPLASVGATGFSWLFEMGVLLVALTVVGAFVLPWLPLLLVAMVLLTLFASGVALLLAVMNVYFRDTEHLLTIVLQVWMYLTPIIYPVSLIKFQSDNMGGLFGSSITFIDIYQLNPMVKFVQLFRELLYDGRLPDGMNLLACAIWAVAILAVGMWVFRVNEKKLAETL